MTQHKSKDNSPAAIKATLKGAMESMFGPDDPAIAAAEQEKIHKQIERLKNALAKGDKKPLEKFAGKPDDALSEIIKSGRIDLLTALLDAGLDVSGNKHYGMVLREAIDSGHADIVRLLIDRGADLDITLSFGSSMLHEAAQCGHAQVIQALLDAGMDVNQPDNRKRTPLHDAADQGYVEAVRALLAAGADLNVPPPAPPKKTLDELMSEKATPLILAAKNGHLNAVRELLKANPDLSRTDDDNRTAYDWARKNKHNEVANLLRAAAPSQGTTVADLLAAAHSGDLPGIDEALRGGVLIDAKDAYEYDGSEGSGGMTALMIAAARGEVKLVEALLSRGANVHELSDDMVNGTRPALVYAAAAGHSAVVKILLDAGAELSASGKGLNGSTGTALHVAAEHGHLEVVKLLISRGARLDEKAGGDAPLHLSARGAHVDVMRALLDAGAKVDIKFSDRHTPLHAAASAGSVEAVKLLLKRGADVNAVGKESTPLDSAALGLSSKTVIYDAEGNRTEVNRGDPLAVMKVLLDAGADPNLAAKGREGPIHTAVQHTEAVRLLLAHKADPNALRHDGSNPVWWATAFNNPEALKLLLDAGADPNTIVKDNNQSALDIAIERKMPKCQKLLEAASAKRAKDLKQGKEIAREKASHTREQNKKAAESHKKYQAMMPDFSKAADSKSFNNAITKAKKLVGAGPEPMEHVRGGFTFKTTKSKARALVKQHLAEFLKKGSYLFSCGRSGVMDDDPDFLGLLPTTDKYQVMIVMGTNAANYSKGPVEVIEELKAIEKEQPFVLYHISFDTLEGEWTQPIKNPGRFAKKLYEFCPDIVDQGCGSVAALSKAIKKDNKLFFWWD